MQYTSQVRWERGGLAFETKTFSRTHEVVFGSGASLQASSAPEFMGSKEMVNPEELFTASISSCFMLTFLYWAAMKGLIIEQYKAEAIGTLAKNAEGKMAMTEVVIKPQITFQENKTPEASVLEELLKKAHDNCFISSSVKTHVKVEMA